MITTLYTNLHVFLHWVHWKNCSPWRISLNHILSPEGHCLFEVVMSFKLFNYLFISSCVFIMGHYFTMSFNYMCNCKFSPGIFVLAVHSVKFYIWFLIYKKIFCLTDKYPYNKSVIGPKCKCVPIALIFDYFLQANICKQTQIIHSK